MSDERELISWTWFDHQDPRIDGQDLPVPTIEIRVVAPYDDYRARWQYGWQLERALTDVLEALRNGPPEQKPDPSEPDFDTLIEPT